MMANQNQHNSGSEGQTDTGFSPDIQTAEPTTLPIRCGVSGPDSWDTDPQGNFFCSLPRGHEGLHHEGGAPRRWFDNE
ncbi:hypothetical protein AB0D46_31760 [Streptomyces sp. NPDC048383]|uniref:hypothetical protein n=1 Tax=Streptomyces sp. NPDC048383 TaxID=3155386 RepID=UPI003426412D